MRKIERYEDESDEDWAERFAEEMEIANDVEYTQYMVHQDDYEEDRLIIEYVGKDSWTWKEYPEGSFTCKQVLEWKRKAEQCDMILPMLKKLIGDSEPLIDILVQKEES